MALARTPRIVVAVVSGLVGLVAALSAPRAFADEAPAAPACVVELFADASTPTESREAVVRAIARAGCRDEEVRAAPLEGARVARVSLRATPAVIEIDLLFASGRRSARSVPRAVARTVEGEEVALVVESALESERDALREGRPPEPPPPPKAPAPTPEAPKAPVVATDGKGRGALYASVHGGFGGFASQAGPVGRVGGGLGVASTSRFRPSLALSGAATLPFESGRRVAEADVAAVNLRLTPAAEWLELGGFSLGTSLGLGLDVVSVSARSDAAGAVLSPVVVRVDPIVSPGVFGRVGLVRNVTLVASFAVDVAPASRTYFAEAGRVRETMLEPWRVRPMGTLGVEVALFGDDRAGRPGANGGAR
ncbi:MAG: hypothetical protein JNM74_22630 [Myxococcales bacterium]|nr:hypothetical protein [Myxococcales bacterium]